MSEATAMQDEPTHAPFPALPARSGPGPVVREPGRHIVDYATEWERRTRAAIDIDASLWVARVDDVLRRQLPVLEALRPRVQLVTCSIGSNDLTRSANAERIMGSLRRMVNAMIRREAPLHGLVVTDVRAAYQAPYRNKMGPRSLPSQRCGLRGLGHRVRASAGLVTTRPGPARHGRRALSVPNAPSHAGAPRRAA